MLRFPNRNQLKTAFVFLCLYVVFLLLWSIMFIFLFAFVGLWMPEEWMLIIPGFWLVTPMLITGLIVLKSKKILFKSCAIIFLTITLVVSAGYLWEQYEESQIISTSNINVEEYLPFDKKSKIATLDHEASLQLTEDLPIVDGATAVFPLYSAFVNATYPETTQLDDGYFEYHNTVGGYEWLARRKSHIFFGAYPSEDQIEYARRKATFYEYTPIGMEAFVFFVHKNNPVDNLTTEQIKGIYSGEITNWNQVGGPDEPIAAYQRNEGSGSQSMLIRFMGDTPLMTPKTEMVEDLMGGIIEEVADYHNSTSSIGFSFRYYLEGIIKNPNIKLLSIDGVAPSIENIRNGKYPITTYLYAVTYRDHFNENVDLLLEWILSPEGQELVEKTGYVPIAD